VHRNSIADGAKSLTEEKQVSEHPITVRERLAYSLFNGADYLIKNVIGKYMFFFYTTTFAINPLWLALWQPLLKILDVVTDPLVGEWSDRTKSKMGKRRPWILFGSIALGIVFPMSWMPTIIMFWDPMPTVVSVFVYFMIFKLLYYITHTVAIVPYYALGAELSTDYAERTNIVAWRHFIGAPMAILATLPFVLATWPGLFESEINGIAVVMCGVGAIIIITGVLAALGTKERATQEVEEKPLPIRQALKITLRNKPFMFLVATVLFYGIGQYFSISFGVYLINYIIFDGDKSEFAKLLFWATAAGAAVSMGLNLWIKRLGLRHEKVRMLKFGMAGALAVPLAGLVAFQPNEPYWYFIFHVLALPIGNTIIEVLPLSIVADVCDIDEVQCGRRREGAFVGVYNSAFKSGYMLAPALSMVCLHFTGFDGTLTQQTEDTKFWLQAFLVAGCGATFLAAFLCSLGIKLRKADIENAQRQLSTS
jgi:GPH family glycoside/pentoside/hexuronide:cation symporter